MTIQKTYIILLLALLCSACEKNYDITTTETEVSEAQELPSTKISGQTTNLQGEIIPNAEVQYYHKDEWHLIQADAQGQYSFELPQDDAKTYLHASAEGFVNSGLKTVSRNQEVATKNIILPTLEELPGDELEDLPDVQNSLATVSGRALFANGEPLVGAIVVLFEISTLRIDAYVAVDADGYFSFTEEPFENRYLSLFRQCGDSQALDTLFSLGTEDIDLGTITTDYVENPVYTFNGFVTDCNTQLGLTTGLISIKLENGAINNAQIVDGFYELEIEDCIPSDCYDVKVNSSLYISPPVEYDCLPLNDNVITNDYEYCGEAAPTYSGNISININNQTYDFTTVAFTQVGNNDEWKVEGVNIAADTTAVFFEIEGLETGTYPVTNFVITSSSFLHYQRPTDTVSSSFTYDSNNNHIEGIIGGEAYDVSTNAVLDFSGSFNIIEQ